MLGQKGGGEGGRSSPKPGRLSRTRCRIANSMQSRSLSPPPRRETRGYTMPALARRRVL